jgi:hypothetical protein
MQIQFKQAEIVAALKQYIIAQGINTAGKSVDIAFSATRGAAGIVADVTIEDANIPGYTDSSADDAAAAKPALSVVQPAPAVTQAPVAEEPQTSGDAPQAEAADSAEDAPAKTTTSLFN